MKDDKDETESNPADQPKAPEDPCKCQPTEPVDAKPPGYPQAPVRPPSGCHCPDQVAPTPPCLDDLISEQNSLIVQAETAKAFKSELEGILTKARSASVDYNQDKYIELLDRWKDQDEDISELTRKLTCSVKCWRCVIECYVCPLLTAMRDAERTLYGQRKKYDTIDSIYDLRHWRERDLAFKRETFDRVKSVLGAWESPAKTLDKILTDNANTIKDLGKTLVPDGAKAVFDVILKLIPRHLAIAPPAAVSETKIEKKYTQFCECDPEPAADCCGPYVGIWTLRQRLVGPLPYLVKPSEHFKIICCLVEKRYVPAKNDFAIADSALKTTENEIKRLVDLVTNGLKGFDATARAAIPATARCCGDDIAEDAKPQTPTT
jgi:hypothetical protein